MLRMIVVIPTHNLLYFTHQIGMADIYSEDQNAVLSRGFYYADIPGDWVPPVDKEKLP